MKALKTLAAASALALTAGASSAAITFTDSDFYLANPNGTGSVSVVSLLPLEAEFEFSATSQELPPEAVTPFFAYIDFTVGREFSLTLEDYQPTNSGSAQSFFSILNVGTGTFETDASTCSTFSNLLAIEGYDCDPVNGKDGTAGNPPPITFSGLAAGNYRVAFYESGDPERVEANFVISAVPLPFAGLLMLTAVGGAAAAYRKRKTA